jgi:site-specific DNA-methyltransferase (adenine-specific)
MKHEILAPGIEIYCADCLDVMRDMPDGSINLIATDPPYNIGKANWDKIPDYVEWCGKWMLECQRALADNGSFYFFHNDMEQVADLMLWIRENTDFVFKQFIVWNKRFDGYRNQIHALLHSDDIRNYPKMAEYILFYTLQDETGLTQIYSDRDCFVPIKEYLRSEKQKSGLTSKEFNYIFSDYTNKEGCLDRSVIEHYWQDSQWAFPTKDIYENVLRSTGFFRREYEDLRREYEDLRREYEDLRREYEDLRYTFNNQKTHHSVWNYEIAGRNGHITPKPVELIKNIIVHSSNEGDVVVDNFLGSGTTGVACVQTGRNFIGIEIDPDYYEIAKKRILEALAQPRLFDAPAEQEKINQQSFLE